MSGANIPIKMYNAVSNILLTYTISKWYIIIRIKKKIVASKTPYSKKNAYQ